MATDLEQKWPAAKVRATYLEYFQGKEHKFGMQRQDPLYIKAMD